MQHTGALKDLSPGRRTAVVGILGALGTVAPFSIDLYLPALPALGRDLGATQQQVAVTITMFFLGLAVGQVQAGALSDTHGRRRPLLAGLLLFTGASLLCALAPTIQVLMAARFLQGLGGAAGMAVSNASVTDYARGREAARLFSRLAMIGGVAPVIAPLIGGQLLHVMSWRGLFLLLAGIGLALGALATPLVDLGGGLDGVSMGIVIAGSGALALLTFAVVTWRDRARDRACDVTPGTCADMTVC